MVSTGLIPLSYGLVSIFLSMNVSINFILLCAGTVVVLFSLVLTLRASALKNS
ncbi:MAG: hypothetical protein PME_15590 [Priestia megaterium]